MEDQPPSPAPADFISALPDDSLLHIVSFLPTASAARTSLLSRRFHRLLYASSTFLNLDSYSEHMTPAQFLDLADQTLVRCSSTRSPLRHLHLRLLCCGDGDAPRITPDDVLSVLDKAGAVGLRHLSVQLDSYVWMWRTVLPCILSIPSLESLSLQNVVLARTRLPPVINLKQLRSLSITSGFFEDGFIDRLVPQLDALEELRLTTIDAVVLDLKSNSLKKLQLAVGTKDLRISTPVLECLELESEMKFVPYRWDFEMPVLRKAVIRLNCVSEENVEAVFKMLIAISHVRELEIDVWEGQDQSDTFPALLVPGVAPPTFLNLKHFKLQICFHEYNIENLPTCYGYQDEKNKLWRSQLQRNAEGNYRRAFEDLHIPGKKEELLGQLMAK